MLKVVYVKKADSNVYFSIFHIVNFPNAECSSAAGDDGVCMTRAECGDIAGRVSGACAQVGSIYYLLSSINYLLSSVISIMKSEYRHRTKNIRISNIDI